MGAINPTPEAIQAIIDNEKRERQEHQRAFPGPHPVTCNVCAATRKRLKVLLVQKRDAESRENLQLARDANRHIEDEQPGFLSRMAAADRSDAALRSGPLPGWAPEERERQIGTDPQGRPVTAPQLLAEQPLTDPAALPGAQPTLYKTIDMTSGEPVFTVQLIVQAHKGAKGKELLDQFEEACKANGWDILAGQTEEKKQ
jgi:hypothetical protein